MDNPSSTVDARSTTARSRALVLGGGGAVGNAWLIGVMAGLFDGGVDVTTADLTIGTSAGSTAAAQVAGATPPDLYAAIEATDLSGGGAGAARGRGAAGAATDHRGPVRAVIAASHDASDFRRRMGAAAMAMDMTADAARQAWWRATVGARLSTTQWPDRALQVTAVDAETAEPVVFDRRGGVDLVDAVAASCAGGFAYRIGDRHYIDGGYRANAENADLAAGHAAVLVLAPFGGRSLVPVSWGTQLPDQVEALRTDGSVVELIVPDGDSQALFGADILDVTRRPGAARAGYELGRSRAGRLTGSWG
jgi:NTE family protein